MYRFLLTPILLRFAPAANHLMDDFMFGGEWSGWNERKMRQVLSPGFPQEDPPSPQPGGPGTFSPTDVPEKKPMEIPVPDPAPPPEPGRPAPPKPAPPKVDPKPRSIP